ncbi:MAG: TetR/AcrR family transcriptional regulator [Alphaproteobacteria bacterium]|nr:TetR/AcrR family transcriptional regulator [Alphaproteobacteria bacterium]
MLQRKTPKPQVDGRRVRGEDNRRRIVDALLKLVRSGVAMPSADEVATEAGVGLRTVFRHFADMESLYREISERMTLEIMPIVQRPFRSEDWRERLEELVERRGQVFERLLPFKLAGDAHRYGSPFLTSEQAAIVKTLREALRHAIGPKTIDDKLTFEALDLMLSFESWRRLRVDQGLSARDSRAVMLLGAEALTSSSQGR